eukprot:5596161-Alexandrium_andersonii.AAC.1
MSCGEPESEPSCAVDPQPAPSASSSSASAGSHKPCDGGLVRCYAVARRTGHPEALGVYHC